MGWREVGGFENLETIDLVKDGEGSTTTCKILGVKPDVGMFGQTVYTVEIDGTKKQFWGSTVLDKKLSEVEVGSVITIVYMGKKPSPERGRQPFKDFRIMVEDPNYQGNDLEKEDSPKDAKKKEKKTPF